LSWAELGWARPNWTGPVAAESALLPGTRRWREGRTASRFGVSATCSKRSCSIGRFDLSRRNRGCPGQQASAPSRGNYHIASAHSQAGRIQRSVAVRGAFTGPSQTCGATLVRQRTLILSSAQAGHECVQSPRKHCAFLIPHSPEFSADHISRRYLSVLSNGQFGKTPLTPFFV